MAENRLLRENNPEPGERRGYVPQHLEAGSEEYSKTEGSDGALHTKILDHNGEPFKKENPVPVQLTGSVIEHEDEMLLDAVSVEPGGDTGLIDIEIKDAVELYLYIITDQAWRFIARDYPLTNSLSKDRFYPPHYEGFSDGTSQWKMFVPVINRYNDPEQGGFIQTFSEARRFFNPVDTAIRIDNESSLIMTVTAKVIRLWRW